MANPNTNPIFYDVLEKQFRKIAEMKERCIEKYGENVLMNNFEGAVYKSSHDGNNGPLSCPASWDGITCWPPTLAGSLARQNCSSLAYIQGFWLKNEATKVCLENGEWFRRNGSYWTNFTECHYRNETTVFITDFGFINNGSTLIKEYLPLLKTIKVTGYTVSLISLIIALSILICIKKLHYTRNLLHMHLFASFILRASIFILKDIVFMAGVGLPSDFQGTRNHMFFKIDLETNNWQCKVITSLWQYFTMANYSWILMEGLYLYNLIFRALFTDINGNILVYVIIGWGFPLIVVSAWVFSRLLIEDTLCWTTRSYKSDLFLEIPTLLSIVINLVFFVKISIVLLNKLISPWNYNNGRYMKWAKSTLVLVPLFGVHYILLFGLALIHNDVVELIWIASDSLLGSFQGFFVAVLYCFLNGEVKCEVLPLIQPLFSYMLTPCRRKLLRSSRGSVGTNLSCSSMYVNSLVQIRNSEF